MSLLKRPRKEVRHVVKDGSAYWGEFKDGRIVFGDGRTCGEDEVVHLPPCDPTEIICVHVNYISRYYEFNSTLTPPKSRTCFQKPATALNAHNGDKFKAS
jgi:5-oxopent-3-ene-1,2,5-tricarboxylate decarboxylase/2-hydroxyhepta-2,4-diene-1,7-dioate isomerase